METGKPRAILSPASIDLAAELAALQEELLAHQKAAIPHSEAAIRTTIAMLYVGTLGLAHPNNWKGPRGTINEIVARMTGEGNEHTGFGVPAYTTVRTVLERTWCAHQEGEIYMAQDRAREKEPQGKLTGDRLDYAARLMNTQYPACECCLPLSLSFQLEGNSGVVYIFFVFSSEHVLTNTFFLPPPLLSFFFSLLSFSDMVAAILTKDAEDKGDTNEDGTPWLICGRTVINTMERQKDVVIMSIKKTCQGSTDKETPWAMTSLVEALQLEAQCVLAEKLTEDYGEHGTHSTWRREQILRHGTLYRVVEGEWKNEDDEKTTWWEGIVTKEHEGEGDVTIAWNLREGEERAVTTRVTLNAIGTAVVDDGSAMPWRVPEFEHEIVGRKVELYIEDEWRAGIVTRRNTAKNNGGRKIMNCFSRGSYWVVFGDGTGRDWDFKEMWMWRIQKAAAAAGGRASEEELSRRKSVDKGKKQGPKKRRKVEEAGTPATTDAPKEAILFDRLPFPLFTLDGMTWSDEIHKQLYISHTVPLGKTK